MHFLCTFRKTWWLRMLKTFSKEQMRCRGCFFQEIKAIGVEKMHQILKILCSFCVILQSLGDLEFQRRSTRNKLVVRKAFLGNKGCFLMTKTPQFSTKNDNIFKMYQFLTFSCNFCQVSKDFMDQNVKYLQPLMISLSNRFGCGDKCSFVK